MNVHISKGNTKLGNKISNISLTPILACGKTVPCKKGCYAKKFLMRPSVKKAWSENLAIARKNPVKFFLAIWDHLEKKRPEFFRWHVAGDFLDQLYLNRVFALAYKFPDIKFLAFTKRFDLDFSKCPKNFSIVLSMWPGQANPNINLPRAWMDDGTETRVPANAIHCPGGCESCGMCWSLKGLKRDVVFHKH